MLELEQQASKLDHDSKRRPSHHISAFLGHSLQEDSSFAKGRVQMGDDKITSFVPLRMDY